MTGRLDNTGNMDSIRVFATALLVGYHVIGIDRFNGMRVEDDSVWRFCSDLLVDLRMPLFAFIAGFVYAIRPLSPGRMLGFFSGKVHRLIVPGIVAALVFWAIGNTLVPDAFSSGLTLVQVVSLSTGHFWFLQTIFLLFLCIGPLDAALGYRAAIPLLGAAAVLSLSWSALDIAKVSHLHLASAAYLAPFFLLGIVIYRHRALLAQRKGVAVATSMLLLLFGAYLNLEVFHETGRLSVDRRDLQSLSFGTGAIVLTFLLFPKVPLLDRVAVWSFTVYLYHPFGTSLVRRIFDAAGIGAGLTWLVFGIAAGFALPIALHILAEGDTRMRRLLLGMRPAGVQEARPPTMRGRDRRETD